VGGKTKKILKTSALAILVLLAATGLGLVPVNLFLAKPAIADAVRDKLGMDLYINGPLRLRFGPRPVLSASELVMSIPAAQTPFLQLDQLLIRPRLFDLLRGNLSLRSLEGSGLEFDYCRNDWPSSASAATGEHDSSPPSLAFDSIRILDVQPSCSIESAEVRMLPERLDLHLSAARNKAVKGRIEGIRDEKEMLLAFTGGSLSDLLENPAAFPIDLRLQALDSELNLTGNLNYPASDPGISAQAELTIPHFSGLLHAFGLNAPDLGSFHASVEFRADGGEVLIERLEGALEDHPFTLSGAARDFFHRPVIKIDAWLEQLDLSRLRQGAGEQGENGEEAADFQAIYDTLSRFDARVKLSIGRLPDAPVKTENLVFEADLEDGVLSLNKAEFMLAGSPVAARAVLDTRIDCAILNTAIEISQFELAQLNPFMGSEEELGGTLGAARFESSSCGATARQFIESLQATLAVSDLNPAWANQDLPMVFQSLESEINWNGPGKISFEGELFGEYLAGNIGFGSIASFRSGQEWPLRITARGTGSMVSIDGEAVNVQNGFELHADAEISVDRFGSLHSWIGADPENRLAFSGRTRLALTPDRIVLDGLEASLGQSDVRGTVMLSSQTPVQPAIIDLSSERLDFRELASLFPEPENEAARDESERTDLFSDVAWIHQWMDFPIADIDLSVSELLGFRYDVSQVGLHVLLRERQVEDGRLALQLEDIGIEGAIDMDFRELPGKVVYDVRFQDMDIGRVLGKLELAQDTDLKADSVDLSLESEGSSLRQLTENAHLSARFEELEWRFETGPESSPQELDLKELTLLTSPGSPLIWNTRGSFNGVPVKALMHTPSLLDSFDNSRDLPLTLIIGTGDDILAIEAVIDRRVPGKPDADLRISGEFMDSGNIDFSQLQPPLGEYEFRSEVAVRENQLLFSGLWARIGKSTAEGTVDLRFVGPGYFLGVELNSPFLETDDLVQWAEDWRNARENLGGHHKTADTAETNETGIMALISEQAGEIIEENDFDIRITVNELRSAGHLLGQTQLLSRSKGNDLVLDMDTSMPGGNLTADYSRMHLQDGVEYGLDIHAERLEYGGLLRLFDPDSEAAGEVYIDTSVRSRSVDPDQVTSNMQGHFDLVAFPDNARADFLDLWASNIVFALLPAGESTGKKMNCMVARFDIEDGVMKSKNTFLDSTDIIVRARGDIDLVRRELDLWAAPQAKLEKFLSVQTPIVVTGPFDDFYVGLAPGGFLTTMLRWYYGLIYVPWKWLTGERFPPDGLATCYHAMDWDLPAGMNPQP